MIRRIMDTKLAELIRQYHAGDSSLLPRIVDRAAGSGQNIGDLTNDIARCAGQRKGLQLSDQSKELRRALHKHHLIGLRMYADSDPSEFYDILELDEQVVPSAKVMGFNIVANGYPDITQSALIRETAVQMKDGLYLTREFYGICWFIPSPFLDENSEGHLSEEVRKKIKETVQQEKDKPLKEKTVLFLPFQQQDRFDIDYLNTRRVGDWLLDGISLPTIPIRLLHEHDPDRRIYFRGSNSLLNDSSLITPSDDEDRFVQPLSIRYHQLFSESQISPHILFQFAPDPLCFLDGPGWDKYLLLGVHKNAQKILG